MSLPVELRQRMREAMQMLPTWKRQETRDTVITARRNGLTIRECAAAAGCSPRHAKRILSLAGMAGMGRADALAKAAPAPAAPAPRAPETQPAPAGRPLETLEESRHRQMVERCEAGLLEKAQDAYEKAHRPEPPPEPVQEYRPPGFLLRDGVILKYNPQELDALDLHPLDRALMRFGDEDGYMPQPRRHPFDEQQPNMARLLWQKARGGY